MNGFRLPRLILLACLLVFLGMACTARQIAGSILLLDQMASARWPENQWSSYRSYDRGVGKGPSIKMETPAVTVKQGQYLVRTDSPTALRVTFSANQAPIDPKSLEVRARYGIIRVDLTDKLAPYIKDNVLEAREVSIPSGHYIIDVRISDTAGNESEVSFHLEVS